MLVYFDHGVERHERPRGGAHVQPRQRIRRPQVLLFQFENHRVLIGRRVDHRYLARSESAVEGILQLFRSHSQGLRAVAVDVHHHLRAGGLQFGVVDVHEARKLLHLGHQLRTPGVDIFQLGALQRELVDAGAELAADADGRRVLQERENARNGHQFGPQLVDHLVHRERPLVARLEVGEHEGLVALPSADTAHSAHDGDVGIVLHDLRDLAQVLRHGVERDVLRAHYHAESEAAVLARNETRRHVEEQVEGAHQHRHRHQHGHGMEAQGDPQGGLVPARQQIEPAFQRVVHRAVTRLVFRFQKAAAQHGRQGQRYESRNQDGHHDGHRELVQQAAHDSGQKQHRDEDRHQRSGHGNNGEADLLGRRQGRLPPRFAHLHVAHDIFQHHDGVVHHEAHGKGERHQ